MKSTIKTIKPNTALCGLLSGMLVMAAGTEARASSGTSSQTRPFSLAGAGPFGSYFDFLGFQQFDDLGGSLLLDQVNISVSSICILEADMTIVPIDPMDIYDAFGFVNMDMRITNGAGPFDPPSALRDVFLNPFGLPGQPSANGSSTEISPNDSFDSFLGPDTDLYLGNGFFNVFFDMQLSGSAFPANNSQVIDFDFFGQWFGDMTVEYVYSEAPVVPEPSSALLALGSGAMLLLRRRRASV